ncbi:hypothetical protein LshimejAT787_3300080 [Lyophyllum shimeji]|uniref:Uncharacterized protein n=1 Tax=Lyophyllum shimeji TaxID=47721 RepID=A0A9P3Q2Y5_LYOSH|nr:hypothetical protein LshimejAT787_3300080 [Lyophyllum shimeji]
MSPGERALLRAIGLALLGDFSVFTAITLLYGIAACIFALCTFTLLEGGLTSRSTQVLFATTLASFLLFTLQWSFVVGPLVIDIRGTMIDSAGTLDRATFLRLKDATAAVGLIEASSAQLLVAISDAIVIWRTWVLYLEQSWIMAGPCMLFAGTIGKSTHFCAKPSRTTDVAGTPLATSFANVVINANLKVLAGIDTTAAQITLLLSLILSLATNVVSTLLVLYRLWSYRRFGRKLGIDNTLTPVQRAMIVLVESGIVFFAIQTLNLILELVPQTSLSPASLATHITLAVLIASTAMYPSIVVLVVNKQKSVSVEQAFGLSIGIKNLEAGDVERGSRRLLTSG